MPPQQRRGTLSVVAALALALALGAGAFIPQSSTAAAAPTAPGLTVAATVSEGGYSYVHYTDPAPEPWTRYVAAGLRHWGGAPACGDVKVLLQSSNHPTTVATANQGACTVWVMQDKAAGLSDWERCVIMVHELGHLYGYGHAAEPNRLMSAAIAWRGLLEPVPVCDGLPVPAIASPASLADDDHDGHGAIEDAEPLTQIGFPVSATPSRLKLALTIPERGAGEQPTCLWSVRSRPGKRWVSSSPTGCALSLPRKQLRAKGADEVRATMRDGGGELVATVAVQVTLAARASARPRVGRRTITVTATGKTTHFH